MSKSITNDGSLPVAFSFLVGKVPSTEWMARAARCRRRARRDDGVTLTTTTWTDRRRGLELEVEEQAFPNSAAREWVLRFRNVGRRPTPILSQVYPLDAVLATKAASIPIAVNDFLSASGLERTDFLVHFARGGMAGPEDYQPGQQALGERGVAKFDLSGAGGRSSNRHIPFFNLQTAPGAGVMVAVGWSGQWHALFEITRPRALRLRAGMEDTHLRLLPGETIRTPRILALPWEGALDQGHNLLRRFLGQYHTPPLAGRRPLPATWANTWFTFNEGYNVNDDNQRASMAGAAAMGIETLTIDAGWYECAHPFWWDGVGSWVPRSDTFPNGFGPLAAFGRRKGIGLGIWFEPERATGTSRIARERPEWLLKAGHGWSDAGKSKGFEHISHLVNLGLPEVQRWLVELIEGYVAQGMTWFRHDFNIEPLPFWQAADAPDRRGIAQVRYIEGLYAILDEIRRRHPGLIMEGCASGGRRIDLETISRNHGYWATDMMDGDPVAMQAHIWGFNRYLLPHLHNTVLQIRNMPRKDTPDARYRFFSFLGGAPCFCGDTRDRSVSRPLARRWVDLFKSVRHLTLGDFHPLTSWSLSDAVWMAYQFHRPDLDQGLVVAFRRPAAPYEQATFKLRGLAPAGRYRLTWPLDRKTQAKTGGELARGFRIDLPNAPSVAIIAYSSTKRSRKDLFLSICNPAQK